MNLQLDNNLCVFDIESTGLDVSKDRIVEISILKVTPKGEETELTLRLNPTIKISKESEEIHGISNEDVKNEPTFKDAADQIAKFIGEADLAGFNSNKFDIPLLAEEFLRINHPFDIGARRFIDVQNIFHKMEQRTLVAAYKFYCDKDLTNAHSADADVKATYEVFKAQIDRYKELENNMDFLAEFSTAGKMKRADFAGRLAYNDKKQMVYNFGKHKEKTVEQIYRKEPGYYGWMMNNDFPLYTKQVLKKEVERIKKVLQKERETRQEREQKRMEDGLAKLKNKFNQ